MPKGNPDPSPENRFPKGKSGNPGGRPRSKPLTRALMEMGARGATEKLITADSTNIEVIAGQLLQRARSGDLAAIRAVFDRIEGKVADRVIHEDEAVADAPPRITIPRRNRKRKRPGRDGQG